VFCSSWAAALVLALNELEGHTARAQAPPKLVVLYNPDANPQALVNVTPWFNEYLHSAGYAVQPVKDRKTLEQLLGEPHVHFAMVSSAYLSQTTGRFTPLLVPSSKGSVHFRKQLLDRGRGPLGELSKANIAVTSTGESLATMSVSLFAQLRLEKVQVEGAHLIPVSKDIDGLLALSFGQVDAAVVAPSSLEILKRINPSAAASLREVARSEPILHAPFCAVNGRVTEEARARMVELLKQMEADENGRRIIHTLGFERWVKFEPAMLVPR
jgi:ABC-type phosphate/phosphonate transport system substrate-binding protein